MTIFLGCIAGFTGWFLLRYLVAGLFTVNQNERAVKTRFGRVERVGTATVRCLSNMKLADMLENRHAMSPDM